MDPLEEAKARVRAQINRMMMRGEVGGMPDENAITQMATLFVQQQEQKRQYGASPQALRDVANHPGMGAAQRSPEQEAARQARLERFRTQRLQEAGQDPSIGAAPNVGNTIGDAARGVGSGVLGIAAAIPRTLGRLDPREGNPNYLTDFANTIEDRRQTIAPPARPDATPHWYDPNILAQAGGETAGEFAATGGVFSGVQGLAGAVTSRLPFGGQAAAALERTAAKLGARSPAAGQFLRGAGGELPHQVVAGEVTGGLIDPESFKDPRAQLMNVGFGMLGALGAGRARANEFRNPMERIGQASEIPQEFSPPTTSPAGPFAAAREPLPSPRVVPQNPRDMLGSDILRSDDAIQFDLAPEGQMLTPRFEPEFVTDHARQLELERSRPVSQRPTGEQTYGDLRPETMDALGYAREMVPLEQRLAEMSEQFPLRARGVPERPLLGSGEQPQRRVRSLEEIEAEEGVPGPAERAEGDAINNDVYDMSEGRLSRQDFIKKWGIKTLRDIESMDEGLEAEITRDALKGKTPVEARPMPRTLKTPEAAPAKPVAAEPAYTGREAEREALAARAQEAANRAEAVISRNVKQKRPLDKGPDPEHQTHAREAEELFFQSNMLDPQARKEVIFSLKDKVERLKKRNAPEELARQEAFLKRALEIQAKEEPHVVAEGVRPVGTPDLDALMPKGDWREQARGYTGGGGSKKRTEPLKKAEEVAKNRAATGETTVGDFDLDKQLIAELSKRHLAEQKPPAMTRVKRRNPDTGQLEEVDVPTPKGGTETPETPFAVKSDGSPILSLREPSPPTPPIGEAKPRSSSPIPPSRTPPSPPKGEGPRTPTSRFDGEDSVIEAWHQRTKPTPEKAKTWADWVTDQKKWVRDVFVTAPNLKGKDIVATRGGRDITRTEHQAVDADNRRLAKGARRRALIEAYTSLQNVMKDLPAELYDLLIRKVRIDDAVEDFSRHGRELASMEMKLDEMARLAGEAPGKRREVADYAAQVEAFRSKALREPGFTKERVEAEQKRLEGLLDANPAARLAVQRHKALVNEVGEKLVNKGLISEDMRENYFPHVIADFVREDGRMGGLPRRAGLNRPRSQNMQRREGTFRDTSGDYVKVMSQYLADTYEMLVKRELAEEIGIRNHLTLNPRKGMEEFARNWKPGDEVPESTGYVEYDLNEGYYHLGARNAGERLIGKMIDESVPEIAKLFGLSPSELSRYVHGLTGTKSFARADPFEGGRKISYSKVLIPKEIADEMRIMAAGDVEKNPIARAIKTYTQYTKSIIIHKNPIQYNLRNFVGDMEAAYAYYGNEMFQGKLWERAIKEVWDANVNKKEAPDWEASNYYGVSSSGRTAIEVAGGGAYKLPDFRKFNPTMERWKLELGKRSFSPRDAATLFRQLPRIATIREDILRHYIYLMNMERHRAGKPMLRGNVGAPEFNGLIADAPERAAGKIARAGLGDYGDFTLAEDFLRNGPMPFYSWMKINLPRWTYHVPKGVLEGAVNPRDASAAAILKGTGALVTALAAIRVWNSWVMGDAEDSLPEYIQNANHIILPDLEATEREGRFVAKYITDADGKRRVAVISVPDAVDHAMEWLGVNGLPADLGRLLRGRMSPEEVGERLKENTVYAEEDASFRPLPTVSRNLYGELAPITQIYDAVRGVRAFPDPLKPREIPSEERLGALISATGAGGLPGINRIAGAADPNSIWDPSQSVLNIPRQAGYKEVAPALRPEYLGDLERRIFRLRDSEIPATRSRLKYMIAGFKSPQMMPEDRREMANRLYESLMSKADQLKKLSERYTRLTRYQRENAPNRP